MSTINVHVRFIQRTPAVTDKGSDLFTRLGSNARPSTKSTPSKLPPSQSSMQIDESITNSDTDSDAGHSLLSFDISPSKLLVELKSLILESRTGKYSSVSLIHCGKILSDFVSVSDTNLRDGDTVTALAVVTSASASDAANASNANDSSATVAPVTHSHNHSHSNSAPRRPQPESILQDLNRLITPELIAPLVDMGFSESRTIKALIINMLNTDIAVQWLIDHTDDPDIDEPLPPSALLRIAMAYHLIPSPDLEQCLSQNVCTFTNTQRQYVAQHYFMCHTCQLIGGRGCCGSCARVCHAGHQVEGPRPSESFFCDCGAGDGPSPCRALNTPPAPITISNTTTAISASEPSPASPPRSSSNLFPSRYRSPLTINVRQPYDFIHRLLFYHSSDSDNTMSFTLTDPFSSNISVLRQQCASLVRDCLHISANNSPSFKQSIAESERAQSLTELIQAILPLMTSTDSADNLSQCLSLLSWMSMILTIDDSRNQILVQLCADMIDWLTLHHARLTEQSRYDSLALLINLSSTLSLAPERVASGCLSFLTQCRTTVNHCNDRKHRLRYAHLAHNLALHYHSRIAESNDTEVKALLDNLCYMLDASVSEVPVCDSLIISLTVLLMAGSGDLRLFVRKLGLARMLEPNVSLQPDDTVNYAKLLQAILEHEGAAVAM